MRCHPSSIWTTKWKEKEHVQCTFHSNMAIPAFLFPSLPPSFMLLFYFVFKWQYSTGGWIWPLPPNLHHLSLSIPLHLSCSPPTNSYSISILYIKREEGFMASLWNYPPLLKNYNKSNACLKQGVKPMTLSLKTRVITTLPNTIRCDYFVLKIYT